MTDVYIVAREGREVLHESAPRTPKAQETIWVDLIIGQDEVAQFFEALILAIL